MYYYIYYFNYCQIPSISQHYVNYQFNAPIDWVIEKLVEWLMTKIFDNILNYMYNWYYNKQIIYYYYIY